MLAERSCRCELSDLQGCAPEPVNTDLKAAGGQGLEGGQWLLATRETAANWREGPWRAQPCPWEAFRRPKQTHRLATRYPRSPLGAMTYLNTHAGDDQPAIPCLQ